MLEAVRNGDLSHVVAVDTEDESGQMNNNINEMIKNVREIIISITKIMEDLVAA